MEFIRRRHTKADRGAPRWEQLHMMENIQGSSYSPPHGAGVARPSAMGRVRLAGDPGRGWSRLARWTARSGLVNLSPLRMT
jgi:hypothetical protein